MTQRIQNAIDIFLDAINNGTLAKSTCVACAVGNLVAAGMKGTITIDSRGVYNCDKPNASWGEVFSTSGKIQHFYKYDLSNLGLINNIKATEFTLEELRAIEFAFETNTTILYRNYYNYPRQKVKADQIKGLEAVVKVMLEFDEQEDNVQEVFTSKAELIAA